MSKISKEEVEKIAKLARIHVTNQEKIKYSKELSNILGYIEKLNNVNTDDVVETSQTTGLENVYQEDDASRDWKADKDIKKNREELLRNAKSKKDEYIKVKQMLN